MPYCKSFDHTIPRFVLNLDPFSPKTIKKNSNNLHAPNNPDLTSNIPSTGWIGQRHFTTMTDSYPRFFSWRRSLSYRNQSIDWSVDWFLYDRELHYERVKTKWWNLPSWFGICPKHLIMKILFLIFLWPGLATLLVNVFLWPASDTFLV